MMIVTSARRVIGAFAAVLLLPALCHAQVMSQVPANVYGVLHVKSVQGLSDKVAAWSKTVGIDTLGVMPPDANLLNLLTKQLHVEQGLKKDGDMAIILVNDLKHMNGPNAPVIVLVPIADYSAFLGNFPNAQTDGAISTVQLGGNDMFIAKWGDYAAMADYKDDLVNATPGGLVITPAAQKELDARDVCILVNMPAVRGTVLPLMVGGRPQILAQVISGIRTSPLAKYANVVRIAFNEVADLVQHILTDTEVVTAGLTIGQDGLNAGIVIDFKPDSKFGQFVAAQKGTDQPLLGGIPEGKYLFLVGGTSDPKQAAELFNPLIDPILAELQNIGPDGQNAIDYIQALKDILDTQTAGRVAIIAPEGDLGVSPLMQMIAIRNGDSAKLAAASRTLLQKTTDLTKAMGGGAASPVTSTYTPAGKTINGIPFDQYHTSADFTALGNNRQLAMIAQIFTFAYGQDGMNMFIGTANDNTYIEMAGLSDEKMSAASPPPRAVRM